MKNILKYAFLLLATVLMASCEEFLDVNDDPNNPVTVSPDLVLPTAQVYTANVLHQNRYFNNLGNMMMYNWSQSDGFAWYPDEFKYNVTSSFYQQLFNYSYSNTLKMYQILDQLESPYDNYKAIAKVMKAYHFQLLVDCYGDIPYSEALLRSQEATPKYDDAKGIYENLILQLDTAILLIKNAQNAVVPGLDDAIFKGNMNNWVKFANTVKLRILVRQSSMAGRDAYLKAEFAKIASEGSGYITADVGVNPGYVQQENKQSPLWNTFGKDVGGTNTMNNNATCATDYILTFLQEMSDPRIDRLYEKPSTGHLGVPQGLLDYDTPVVDAYMPEKVSNIGPGILKGPNMPAIVYTLAESFLNQAEARQRGLITTGDDAKTLYQKGIQASFTTLGAGDATAYYSQVKNLAGWDASSNKIQAIITQKWIAVNGMSAEQSWFDYSRTGYPAGLPISLQATTSNRPVRLFYPAGEYSSNGANVPAQPNAFTEKIFWGK
ncbi:MAG: SusD/RagB family nutrient-binding outer membrane lipoprotein [Bacteroidota bacterium]